MSEPGTTTQVEEEDRTGRALAKIDLKSGATVAAIIPADIEQAWRLAQLVARSPFRPKDNNTPEALVVAILHGMELGLMPMQSVQSIAVINSRPTVWGDAALGLVEASGRQEDFIERLEGEGDQMVAICTTKRIGRKTPTERRFSVEDARRAGLWKKPGPWTNYPQRMLQMRARSWALRDTYADVLKGLAIREEIRDISPALEAGASERERVSARQILDQSQPPSPPPVDVPVVVVTPWHDEISRAESMTALSEVHQRFLAETHDDETKASVQHALEQKLLELQAESDKEE